MSMTNKADQPADKKIKKSEQKKPEKKSVKKADTKPGAFQRLLNYVKAVKTELSRVIWPTRDELVRMSIIVVCTLLFFGVLIFLVDSGVTPLLNLFSQLRAE
jgi:preprotein translocase subunit SecE